MFVNSSTMEQSEKPENDSQQPSSSVLTSNPNVNEFDAETAAKLRGDALGDTMYSEVFVIKCLFQFSDLQWSKAVEEDLCSLWDMTSEQDVCKYLLDAGFPTLAQSALLKYDEPRFMEIVIGIFANVMCSEHAQELTEDSLSTVLSVCGSDDPLILIQVMRFIYAVSFKCRKMDFINRDIIEKILFILMNSLNKDLVTHTLKTLASITSECKISANSINGDILKAAVCGFRLVKKADDQCDLLSQDLLIVAKHFVEIVCNLSSYVDNFKSSVLQNELKVYLDDFFKEISELLSLFASKEYLEPMTEELVFYLQGLNYICKVLNAGYDQQTFANVSKILFNLDSLSEDFEAFVELFCYFISKGDVVTVKTELLRFDNAKVRQLLSDVHKKAFAFEFSYLDKLQEILLDE